jgi:hypothetical protein
MRALSIPLTTLAVVLADEATTLPQPTLLTDGADITGWRSGSFAPRDVLLELVNNDAADAVVVDQLELFGHIAGGAAAAWASFGLVTTYAVTIPASGRVYLRAPQDAACALVDRWKPVASVAGGAGVSVTVRAIPLEVQGSR